MKNLYGVSFPLVYGFLAAFAFQIREDDIWATMAISFIFLLPVAIGVVTVYTLEKKGKASYTEAIFIPWVPCVVLGLIVILFAWEAAICVIMALPIYLFGSTLGGLLTVYYYRRKAAKSKNETSIMGLIMILPFLFMSVESQLPSPVSIRTIETAVVIDADAETIWQNLIAVPEIQPEEARLTSFSALSLPMPIKATLSHEGIGGIRRATYSNGLSIVEPVTEWVPYERITFLVELDPDGATPPIPFEQLGGDYFDVRQVGFTLEPQSDGTVLLQLRSTHRLSTRFNAYGGLWTDFLLRDFQEYILEVVKGRAEKGGSM